MVADGAPPRIVGVWLHCLFKSHTVTKAGCVSAQGSGWDMILQPVINQTIRLPVASGIVATRLARKVAELIRPERSRIRITHAKKNKNTARFERLPRSRSSCEPDVRWATAISSFEHKVVVFMWTANHWDFILSYLAQEVHHNMNCVA